MNKYLLITILIIIPIKFLSACKSAADCSFNGVCAQSCICFKGYATLNSMAQCNYVQKDITTAFVIQFFAGFTGGAWFYIGRYELGIISVLSVTSILVHLLLVYRYKNVYGYTTSSVNYYIGAVQYTFVIIFWIIGIFLIGANVVPDNNNMLLSNW
jgi:hypothetical protein